MSNKRFLAVGLLSTVLAACVADQDPDGSSSSEASSQAPVSSAPVSSSSIEAQSSSSAGSSVTIETLRFQAQDYDRFNESDPNREGADSGVCGQGDVDLVETNDDGICAIGYTAPSEWVEFDVSGLSSASYEIIARASSGVDGTRLRFTVGQSTLGNISVNNSGWNTYNDYVVGGIAAAAGVDLVVRVEFPDGAVNLNYFEMRPTQSGNSSSLVNSSISSSEISSTPVLSSSSEVAVSSSSSQSDLPKLSDADLANGEREYGTHTCAGCHNYKGDGVFTALTSPDFNVNTIIESDGFAGLVKVIEDTMPFGGAAAAAKCIEDCARDTAAWMLELAKPQDALSCDANELSYGLRTARLLNVLEFKNSLVDLNLIDENDFKSSYEYASGSAGKSRYVVNTTVAVDESRLDKLMVAAEELSVVAAGNLKQESSCGSNCKQAFLSKAERLYRRPLTAQEAAVFDKIFADYEGDAALEVALYSAISSPNFVYRSEVGIPVSEAIAQGISIGSFGDGSSKLAAADPNAFVLTNYELAAALSYMYTGSTPDETLHAAARNNQLNTEGQVVDQIDRLMQTSRGKEHTGNFGATWFLADTVRGATRIDPKFTDDIKHDMSMEVRELFNRVMYDDSVPFSELYSSDTTVVNRRLAQYYGINSPSNNNDNWVATTSNDRGGILTAGAFMVSTASDAFTRPIIRAVEVRELMLCHVVPPPNNISLPPERQEELKAQREQSLLEIQVAFEAGTLTSREYFEKQTEYEACDSCHKTIINPLFGLDDFDAYGLPRTTQTGVSPSGNGAPNLPVDNNGTLYGFTQPGDESEFFEFRGTKDLGRQMADLPAVRECLATNTFRWLTDMPIEKKAYSKQANGAIDEQVLLSDDQVDAYACVKQDLVSELGSADSARNVYRKVGSLDLIRLRRSISPSQLQN